MSTQQIKSNPFAKASSTSSGPKQTQPQEKKDTMRDNVKNQLLNALEAKSDAQITNIKHISNVLSVEIEKCVFEQKGSDSRSRDYREKIRKLESRLKGNRNTHVREALKSGNIEVLQFCELDDKTLDDESYFQSLCQKEGISSSQNTTQPNPQQNPMKTSIRTNLGNSVKPIGIKPPTITKLPTPISMPSVHPIEETNNIEESLKESKKEPCKSPDKPEKNIEMSYVNENNNEKPPKEIRPMIEIGMNEDNYQEPVIKPEEKKIIPKEPIKKPVKEKVPEPKEDYNYAYLQTDPNENASMPNDGLDMPAFLDLKKKLEMRKKNKKTNKETKKQPPIKTQPQDQKSISQDSSSQKIKGNNPKKKSLPIIIKQEQVTNNEPIQNKNPFAEEEPIPIIQELIIDQPQIICNTQPLKEEEKKEDTNEIIVPQIIQTDNEPEEHIILSQPEPIASFQPKEEEINNPIEINQPITQEQTYPMSAQEHHPTTNIIQHNEISPILTHSTKQQDFIHVKSQSNANENYLSSSQMESSYSLVNASGIKEKYKVINEAKLALETRMEVMKLESFAYQKEIAALKASLNQLRQTSSQSSEEILKLEIRKMKQLVKNKDNEKELIIKENNKLKTQLKTYEDNLGSMIEDNKLFRIETEKRFTLYQKDIDLLRNQLAMKINNNLQTASSPMKSREIERPQSKVILPPKMIDRRVQEDTQNTQSVANGIPEQNLDGINNNFNMNGNIYDESKHDENQDNNDNDSQNNQNIPMYEDNQQLNDFNEDIIINDKIKEDNNEYNEIEIKSEEDNENNYKEKDNEKILLKEREIINPIVNKNENLFDKQENTHTEKSKPTTPPKQIKKIEEISPNKPKPDLNALFGSDDDDNVDNIFSSKPKPKEEKKISPPTQIKKPNIPVKTLQVQPISSVPQSKPQTVQPVKTTQKTNKPTKTVVDKNNLFDEFEDYANDEDIFNKNDGESIFGKSNNKGNSIFD